MARGHSPGAPVLAHIRVTRAADFDPYRCEGLTPEHYFLLETIGTIDDASGTLHDLVAVGIPRFGELFRELRKWGAVLLLEAAIDVADEPVLDKTGIRTGGYRASPPTEAAAPSDLRPALSDDSRRKVDGLWEACQRGVLLESLGLSPKNPQEMVRMLRHIVHELSPESLSGIELGASGPRIAEVRGVCEQALRTVADPRSRPVPEPPAVRRKTPRFAYSLPVLVRTPLLPRPLHAHIEDISEGGVFVVTEGSVPKGAPVTIEIAPSETQPVPIEGEVRWRRGSERCDSYQRPGLGVRLSPKGPAEEARYRHVLRAARRAQPNAFGQFRPRSKSDSAIIGIDLGTTYTYVSAAMGSRVTLLPFENGRPALPSVIAFPSPGQMVVGEAARGRLQKDPTRVVASAKRLLGASREDREAQRMAGQAAFPITWQDARSPVVEMWGEQFAIPQLCAAMLQSAKKAAQRALGCAVERAVLTVPVSFDDNQRQLMRRAGHLAQLEIVDIIEEPNAAALANVTYDDFGGLIGVYDFGGGTFDFSVVDARYGDFRVLATAGDSWLGGDDLDLAMADALANHLWRRNKVDLRNRQVEWQMLLESCENAKRTLSEATEAQVHVAGALRTRQGLRDMSVRITRAQAEQLWQESLSRSMVTCRQAMAMMGIRPRDLSAIYLSGGTTRIPKVREHLAGLGLEVRTAVPPDAAVCIGAGIHAAQLERRMGTTLRWG